MIAQFLSYSIVVEKIIISPKAWLYEMLFLRHIGFSDLARKDACWSVGLPCQLVCMLLLISSLFNIVSINATFLGEILKSNLIVLCFSCSSIMNVHIINIS